VVVGSAIVQKVAELSAIPDMPARIGEFVASLAAAVKEC
jgi:tryptophan synthase alpha subunit